MRINLKARAAAYVVFDNRAYRGIKMIDLAASGAFHVEMTFAFFASDILINKASRIAPDRAVNKSVFNKLRHKAVNRALAQFFIVDFFDYFFYCECLV